MTVKEFIETARKRNVKAALDVLENGPEVNLKYSKKKAMVTLLSQVEDPEDTFTLSCLCDLIENAIHVTTAPWGIFEEFTPFKTSALMEIAVAVDNQPHSLGYKRTLYRGILEKLSTRPLSERREHLMSEDGIALAIMGLSTNHSPAQSPMEQTTPLRTLVEEAYSPFLNDPDFPNELKICLLK